MHPRALPSRSREGKRVTLVLTIVLPGRAQSGVRNLKARLPRMKAEGNILYGVRVARCLAATRGAD